MLIGKTSALTMNIAGVIKDWFLIFFSYYVFRAPVTRLNLLGYVFCLSGVWIQPCCRLWLLLMCGPIDHHYLQALSARCSDLLVKPSHLPNSK